MPRSPAARTHALCRNLDRALAAARARDLDWEVDRDLAALLDHYDTLVRVFDHEGSFGEDSLARLDDVVLALGRARSLASSRPRARNLIPILDRARSQARGLRRVFERELTRDRVPPQVRSSVRRLEPAAPVRGTTLAPSTMSRGLVALAVLLLPARDQARYREEFHAELVEQPRREQLWHACGLLLTALALRAALIDGVRSPDEPPRRVQG